MTKFGGNRSGHVEAISLGSVARRRKKKKKETSKIQYPAGYSGRVKKPCSKDLSKLVAMVTALLLRTVTRQLTEPQCIRTNQKFHHKFSAFECMKISKLCSSILTFVSHYPVLQIILLL